MPTPDHREPGMPGPVEHPWFSRMYPWTERALERAVGTARRAQNQQASGRTLIIGAGTGLDVPALGDGVTELTLLEPDATMRRTLAQRFPEFPLVTSPAEVMPFETGSFDTVISTLVLCSVMAVEHVLQEVNRVLAPGGQYLFLEHVANSHRGGRWIQQGIEPVWRQFGGGCRLTRDIQTAVIRSPLVLTTCESIRNGVLLPVIRGHAVPGA